jgi:hypothetical protein
VASDLGRYRIVGRARGAPELLRTRSVSALCQQIWAGLFPVRGGNKIPSSSASCSATKRLLRDTAPVLTHALYSQTSTHWGLVVLAAAAYRGGLSWREEDPVVYVNEAVAQSMEDLPRCGQTFAEASKRTARDNDIAEAKAALAQVAEAQKGDAVAFRVVSRLAEGGSERLQVTGARDAPGQNLDQPARGSSKVTCRRRVRGRLDGLFVSTHAHDRVSSFRALPRRHCPDAEVTR